jgi:nicotinamidase-related amidase
MVSPNSPVCRASDSVLLIVDVQQRLAAAMLPDVREGAFRAGGILLQAAARLNVPVLVTEQYPKGLGPTAAELDRHIGAARRIEKTSFSALETPAFAEALRAAGRRQVVLGGMEAHVCVLQTALDLHAAGFEVFVVDELACSRSPRHQENAMARLRQAGIVVTNAESVVFEWLGDSRHEQFRAVSALVK